MNKTVYDVLYDKKIKLEKPLRPQPEALARAIIASGKMRIDADLEANFVRLLIPEERIDTSFSARELTDKKLHAASQTKLMAILSKRYDAAKAQSLTARYLEKAYADLKKRHALKPQTELMIARALVLCNALPVIALLHQEGAEIFISFGQSVGEMMDVARWEKMGENSGLQAVGGGENAVYVSCGGHPFLDKDEARHSGDGPPALARFMIIAAQETGHNGDMIRGKNGRWVGRHSAINWQQAPSEKARLGRNMDINRCTQHYDVCLKHGLRRLIEWERHVAFYREHKLRHRRFYVKWLMCKLGWLGFKWFCKFSLRLTIPPLQKAPSPATQLSIFYSDMLANLTPVADVYRRKNPLEEEAIACIEAVARVPQQVVKWGHKAVFMTTPELYKFYYRQIVPACAEALKRKNSPTQFLLQRSMSADFAGQSACVQLSSMRK